MPMGDADFAGAQTIQDRLVGLLYVSQTRGIGSIVAEFPNILLSCLPMGHELLVVW